jgi:acyl-CoA reductase-like NAD-dependent aldehyde dehydrogenase
MIARYSKFFIGGEWVPPASGQTIEVISPDTEEVIGAVPAAMERDVDGAVDAARRASEDPAGWGHWDPARRADALGRLADVLERRGTEVATAVSSQNGMPIAISSQTEAVLPSVLLRYYASLAAAMEVEEHRTGLFGGTTVVRHQPVGVVGAIVPWNFPAALAAFKYAPSLAAGCTVVLKPSPETVLDSFILAEAVEEAGLPAGVLNIVPAGAAVGAYLVSHPGVDKVAFTGSTATGRSVAEACARLLRPVTLELGGKSAAILLDDASLDLAEIGEKLFWATLLNNGQTCYLGTRILAPQSRYDEVIDAFKVFAGSLTVGPALEAHTQIGPVVSSRHRDRVESYIAKGRDEGARVVLGGGRPDRPGWFVEPTLFADVDNKATIAQEEIFGPVLSVIPYANDDAAVAIANDSDYGLGGTVWTSDPERGLAVARRVQSGSIGLNGYLPDPTAPFGGIKSSGIGRELGPEGFAAYQTLKSIYL